VTRVPTNTPLTLTGFIRVTNVSRETADRLAALVDLLAHWNRRINLVGRNTLGDVWRRHILDSAQLYPLIPREARTLVDLGSGAGFPGLVLAIMGVPEVHLIESDTRKCVFLSEAARLTGAPVTVHPTRIERAKAPVADVITARALAPLAELLSLSVPFRRAGTLLLFPKGQSVEEELTEAEKAWSITVNRRPSVTDPSGFILSLEAVLRESCD
jgi:16S rRNA (guanine527-N7)-methyltransferase